MTGCNTADQCRIAAETYVDILHRCIPEMRWELRDFRIQNVVCSANTK